MIWISGCLSGTASGRWCRLDCFPTAARSAAMAGLCLDFCFFFCRRLTGGDLCFGRDGACDFVAEFFGVFAFVCGGEFPAVFPEVNAPGFVFPFLVRARLPETLQFGRVCEEGRFLVSAAAPHASVELGFARFGMIQDGLHVWHVPNDGPG